MHLDIKYGDTILDTITSETTIEYNTKNKYLNKTILVDVLDAGVDPTDATATSADILASKTAYIADKSKTTGTILTYNWDLKPVLN